MPQHRPDHSRPAGRAWRALLALLVACAVGAAVIVATPILEVIALARAGDELVRETEALERRARNYDPDAVLHRLGPSRWNGSYVLLLDQVDDASVTVEPLGDLPPLYDAALDGQPAASSGDATARHAPEVVGGRSTAGRGTLRIEDPGAACLRIGNLALDTRDVGDIELRLRSRRGKRLWLSFSGAELEAWPEPPPSPCCRPGELEQTIRRAAERRGLQRIWSVVVDLVPDGLFHTYRIRGAEAIGASRVETVRTLFVHPSDAADDLVEIDQIRVLPRLHDFARTGWRVEPVTMGAETRPSIACLAPCSMAFTVEVPAAGPRLDLGYAVLDGGSPVRFGVSIESGGALEGLLSDVPASEPAWTDRDLDLGPWAGEVVNLRLDLDASSRGSIGYWSDPVVRGERTGPFNVLLVVEDTMRADHLSAYGHAHRTSPAKERLAASGVRVEQAFSQAPATRTSVPSYMTSLYPGSNGVWTLQHRLDRRYLTLAEVLRSQGFVTASFIENNNAGLHSGLDQGFQQLVAWGWEGGAEGLYGTWLPRWLDEHSDRNWFVYLHVFDPHGPYDPPPPWDHWYREEGPGATVTERGDRDPDWVTTATREGRQLLYDGEIERNDHFFGSLMDRLASQGLRDHTLVVFHSDHGEHLGEHLIGGNRRPLYAHSAPTYATGVHVPLLLSLPGVLPEGVVIRGPVPLLDVMPTILDLAGIDGSGLPLQGRSLLPAIEAGRFERDRIVLSEEPTHFLDRDRPQISASIFFRDWHLLSSQRLERSERYDYLADPMEQRAVGGPMSRAVIDPVVRSLLRRFADAQVGLRRALAGDERVEEVLDPAERDHLRALGYLD